MNKLTIIQDDVLRWLQGNQRLAQNGFIEKYHAVLCDPPYGLAFMNKKWDMHASPQDYQAWVTAWASPMIDFVYPGALGFFCGGTRTYHRLAAGLEDAGWEIVDSMIVWLHGQGFPKGGTDKQSTTFRNLRRGGRETDGIKCLTNDVMLTIPLQQRLEWWTEERRWKGWSLSLKPSYEPIVIARAPRGKHTFADLALAYGSGALNIDGGRINHNEPLSETVRTAPRFNGILNAGVVGGQSSTIRSPSPSGRWPSNVAFVHHPDCEPVGVKRVKGITGGENKTKGSLGSNASGIYGKGTGVEPYHYADADGMETVTDWRCHPDCPVRALDEQSGVLKSGAIDGTYQGSREDSPIYGTYGNSYRYHEANEGTASRYFYQAKAHQGEREAGLKDFALKEVNATAFNGDGGVEWRIENGQKTNPKAPAPKRRNSHPTVKPVQLTEYLARLLLPPPLDTPRRLFVPFAGSGSEMIGAHFAGWEHVTGIEMDADYVAIARARLAWWRQFANYEQAAESMKSIQKGANHDQKLEAAGQLPLFMAAGD